MLTEIKLFGGPLDGVTFKSGMGDIPDTISTVEIPDVPEVREHGSFEFKGRGITTFLIYRRLIHDRFIYVGKEQKKC